MTSSSAEILPNLDFKKKKTGQRLAVKHGRSPPVILLCVRPRLLT